MKILIDTFKNTGNLHHAYAIEGKREAVAAELIEFLETSVKVKTTGNPDFSKEEFDSLKIEDARAIF